MISKFWTISLLLVRIRIPNTDPDDNQESQINADPDPKRCKNLGLTFTTSKVLVTGKQCCGSMTFWCGSGSGFGSADPCLRLMDPDANPDPDQEGSKTKTYGS
jgi:hypothetical protein